MITDAALAGIAERLDLWINHRDLDSLRDDDLRELLAELRTMRRQHAHDVALLTSCRQRYSSLDTEYRSLVAQVGYGDRRADLRPEDHWREARAADLAEQTGLAAEAAEADAAAEAGGAP